MDVSAVFFPRPAAAAEVKHAINKDDVEARTESILY